MTTTATPATVARRTGMFSGVLGGPRLDSPGARLHTDEELTPAELAAVRNEKAAQALANRVTLDLAIVEVALADTQQALFDMTVQRDALLAENATYVPLLGVLRDDVRRGVASPNLRAALVAWGERQV